MNKYKRRSWILSSNKCCWRGEFVKMKIWNLQSLVCAMNLWKSSLKGGPNFWLTVLTGISDPELVFGFHSSHVVMCSDTWELHGFNSCGWGAEDDAAEFAKTFPSIPCVSQMLGGPSLRRGSPTERLRIPPGTGWGGKDTGRLVTWEFPLLIPKISSESFTQSISFCKSSILPVNSKIVSWSSTNRLAIVSKVELWNFFNFSISLRLFWWPSRESKFCFNNCSWKSCWSRRWSFSAWAQWSSSCWDSIISLILVHFFGHSQPETHVSQFPPGIWRDFAPSVGPTRVLICECSVFSSWPLSTTDLPFLQQRVSPFVRTRTTTTDQWTSLLAGSNRLALMSISLTTASS